MVVFKGGILLALEGWHAEGFFGLVWLGPLANPWGRPDTHEAFDTASDHDIHLRDGKWFLCLLLVGCYGAQPRPEQLGRERPQRAAPKSAIATSGSLASQESR